MDKTEIALQILLGILEKTSYTVAEAKEVAEAYNLILQTLQVPTDSPEK